MMVHPVAMLFPMLPESELRRLADDIKANGLQQPLVVQDDTLLDGRNRLAACKLAGVHQAFVEYKGSDPVAFIIGANLHRRHLSESQRAMIAAKLANLPAHRPDKSANLPTSTVSQSAAAELMKVSERSVRDAKMIQREAPELADKVRAGDLSVHAAKEQVRPHVAYNSGDNEWYTPKPYIEAARAVLGGIDLDPASTADANAVVRADDFYSEEDDGIKHDWKGRVWMNPPYASELVSKFIHKLATAVDAKSVTDAIVLVNNATDTKWFARLAEVSSFLCFPSGRIRFWHPKKPSCGPLQGQCIAYIGKHGKRFCSEFRRFGLVAEIVR